MTSRYLIPLFLFVLASPTMYAAEKAADVIKVSHPFSRASIPGMNMSAAFMTLTNTGQEEHLLVALDSDIANIAELHGHEQHNNMMRMRPVAHIHIKPGQRKTLKPGGLHAMLIGLKSPLIAGQQFKLKLSYDDGSEQTHTVPVKSITANH